MKCEKCCKDEAVVKEPYALLCARCWLKGHTRGNDQLLDKPLNNVYAKKSIKPT